MKASSLGQAVIIGSVASVGSDEHLERLSKIGRLLTGFEDTATTVTAVVEEARLFLPLRSMVLIELVERQAIIGLWYDTAVSEARRSELVGEAKRRLRYLTAAGAGPSGWGFSASPVDVSVALSSRDTDAVEASPRVIALPLVATATDIFGVVLFEFITDDPTGEDLVCAAAIVNHLAVALDAFRSRTKGVALGSQIKEGQQARAMATLVGGVAHHFNNQLTIILANAELVQMEIGGSGHIAESFTDIRAAGARLVALTKQLLAIGRNQRALKKRLSVNDLIVRLAVQLNGVVGGAKGGLEITLGSEIWLVDIDVTQLEVVISALVQNAHEAGRDTRKLRLTTWNATTGSDNIRGDFVALSVMDQGIGMDRTTRDRMFEPFFSTKDPGLVAGLGLAVVDGIVAMNGGHIGVVTAPGKGTTVTVFLPAIPPSTLDRKTILVSTSDPVSRARIARARPIQDHIVIPAQGWDETVSLCSRFDGSIDAIVLDPEAVVVYDSIFSAVHRLRLLRPAAGIIVILDKVPHAHLPTRKAAEGLVILAKPYSAAQLARAVQAALSSPQDNQTATSPGAIGRRRPTGTPGH